MTRQDILAAAWGECGQRFGGYEAGPLSSHRMRILEVRRNPFFSSGSTKSEVQGLAEVFYVLTSAREVLAAERTLPAEEWDDRVDARWFDLTEEQVAEFEQLIRAKIQQINAAATESEAQGKRGTAQPSHA